jgi:hypothetical protein
MERGPGLSGVGFYMRGKRRKAIGTKSGFLNGGIVNGSNE